MEEIEQMNSLFQVKQRELVMAVSKVEELSRQLEILKNGKMDTFHNNQSSVAELDSLYKELQVKSRGTNGKHWGTMSQLVNTVNIVTTTLFLECSHSASNRGH